MESNLFEKAISENKLDEFAIELNDYFIADREYGGHWVLASWQQYIIELLNSDKKIEEYVIQMFNRLIESNLINNEIKTNLLLYHLHVYYYSLVNKKINGSDILETLEDKIINEIELTKTKNKSVNEEQKNDKLNFAIELIKKNGGLKKYYH